jgi:hypothetical protein
LEKFELFISGYSKTLGMLKLLLIVPNENQIIDPNHLDYLADYHEFTLRDYSIYLNRGYTVLDSSTDILELMQYLVGQGIEFIGSTIKCENETIIIGKKEITIDSGWTIRMIELGSPLY